MIPIVEDYLSDLIESKLAYLKANPDHLNGILSTSANKLGSLKTFIQSNNVKVVRGYPRDQTILPCICILLSDEEETQDGLGDYGEGTDYTAEITEQVTVIDVPDGRLPIPYAEVSNKPMVSISSVIHNELGTELDPTDYFMYNEIRGWIGLPTGIAEDGDTLTVTYTYKSSATEEIEVLYDSNFRLEVWTENGDLTVHLYHILKWILLSGRDHLIGDYDLIQQRLSGADFEPVPSYFPSFVYRRALKFWCQFITSASTEDVIYISNVETNQTFYSGESEIQGGNTNG